MTIDNKSFFGIAEEMLAEGQRVRLTVKGSSMHPTLEPGDEIVLAPVEEQVEVGDVVLFRIGGEHRLHRIVSLDGERVEMQGDNCVGRELCRRSDIVARMVETSRWGEVGSEAYARASRKALHRRGAKAEVAKWCSREGRKKLRLWYFAVLAVLMWAPLNGLGVPLDNYLLGLRADHLLHASVFLPCAAMLIDVLPSRWLTWLCAVGIGVLTESVQYLLPYRGFDINDMVANFLGVSIGLLIFLLARRAWRKRA